MLDFLFTIAWLLGTLTLTIIFHEFGHFAYFYYLLHKKVRIRVKKVKGTLFPYKILVGDKKDYASLSWINYRNMASWGVFGGFIPILLLVFPLAERNLLFLVFLMYVLGCIKDIRYIERANKEVQNERKR